MSLLTETLNRIRAWIEKNYPENLVAIPPGLQLSQIRQMVEILPFKLPNEVYELYQWSCGIDEATSCNFYSFMIPFGGYDTFYLWKLEQIEYEDIAFENELGIIINYLGKPLYPIFRSEVTYIFVVGDIEEQKDSPIILLNEEFELIFLYTNLTTMMLELAECLETIPLDKKGSLLNLYKQVPDFAIYCKYNHELPNLSITNILRYLSDVDLDTDRLHTVLNHFEEQLSYVMGCWENFSFEQFSPELLEPLIAATQHEEEYIRLQATGILNILRDIMPT